MQRPTVKHGGVVAMGNAGECVAKGFGFSFKGGIGQMRSIREQIHPGGHRFAILVTRA